MKNTLQTLQNKRKSKKGFTLMEMLIVVAIIAILVAISIPVFNAQLDKARTNTDLANERAAKAVVAATYLTSANPSTITGYYDAVNGKIETDDTKAKAIEAYGKATGHTNDIIKVAISDSSTGEVTIKWVTAKTLTE